MEELEADEFRHINTNSNEDLSLINQKNIDNDIVCMTEDMTESNFEKKIKGEDKKGSDTRSEQDDKNRQQKRRLRRRRKRLLRNLRESQIEWDTLSRNEVPVHGNENSPSGSKASLGGTESHPIYRTERTEASPLPEEIPSFDKRNIASPRQEPTQQVETKPPQELGNGKMLDNIINNLSVKIKTQDPYISNIKRPQLLLQSLQELNDMVGMDRLKEGVTLQIVRLIEAINNGETDLGMLNTILYGEPGVGKTRIGLILAKIWYSIGFLENNAAASGDKTDRIREMIVGNELAIYGFIAVIIYGWTAGKSIYQRYGVKGVVISLIVVAIIAGVILYVYAKQGGDIEESDLENNRSDDFDRSIIKVASREDFVSGYLGQSAIKTKALLQSCIGKVLFVDEAYSLFEGAIGYGDPYGAEALTAINLFLSENPGKIVVVFAGYKDKMQQGIFKAQPGLSRRCMWHFECDSYDGEQLGDIFLRQLGSKGWRIDNPRQVKHMISEQANLFPSYGGDTERLIFYSQLAASKNHFYDGHVKDKNTLSIRDVTDGLQFLSENNIHKNKDVGMKSPSHDNGLDDTSNDQLASLLSRIEELS